MRQRKDSAALNVELTKKDQASLGDAGGSAGSCPGVNAGATVKSPCGTVDDLSNPSPARSIFEVGLVDGVQTASPVERCCTWLRHSC